MSHLIKSSNCIKEQQINIQIKHVFIRTNKVVFLCHYHHYISGYTAAFLTKQLFNVCWTALSVTKVTTVFMNQSRNLRDYNFIEIQQYSSL